MYFFITFKYWFLFQFIFAAEETTATTTTYANTNWKGPFCSMDPSSMMMPTTIRILDFYRMNGNKIQYNWMMIDTVDLMRQSGRQVLPKVKSGLCTLKVLGNRFTSLLFIVKLKRGICSTTKSYGWNPSSNFKIHQIRRCKSCQRNCEKSIIF